MDPEMMTELHESVEELLGQDSKLGLGTDLIRTCLARGVAPQEGQPTVDREARVINGVALATKGIAEGHGLLLDDKFLDQLTDAGNKSKLGVKVRFDHPSMSSSSMGKTIGRAKNLRRDGDITRGDVHLLEAATRAPEGDLAGHTMDLAEEAPDLFGMSVVFKGKHEDQLDERGNPKLDAQGGRLPKLARIDRLFAADVVDEPAANPSGMFSQDTLASRAHAFLDKWQAKQVSASQNIEESTQDPHVDQTSNKERDNEMSNPKETETPQEPPVDIAALQKQAREEERARVNGIRARGSKLGCSEELLSKLVEEGTSLETAYGEMIDDADSRHFNTKNNLLGKVNNEANQTSGLPEPESEEFSAPEGVEPGSPEEAEAIAKQEWSKDKKLQDEFPKFSTYAAFKKHEKNIKILGSKVQ